MIKSELIAQLAAENPHLTQRDIERVVGVIFDKMTDALAEGGRVELRGFGAFSVRSRPARSGRNPRTGETGCGEGQACAFFQERQGTARTAQRRLTLVPTRGNL